MRESVFWGSLYHREPTFKRTPRLVQAKVYRTFARPSLASSTIAAQMVLPIVYSGILSARSLLEDPLLRCGASARYSSLPNITELGGKLREYAVVELAKGLCSCLRSGLRWSMRLSLLHVMDTILERESCSRWKGIAVGSQKPTSMYYLRPCMSALT